MTMLADFSGLVRPLFIETGTAAGNTLANAAKAFEWCASIEQNEAMYQKATERFADVKNVRLFHGLSQRLLPNIMDAKVPTTFWLDAHYHGQGAELGFTGGQCPLLEELQAIVKVPWETKPIILIDDGHMFDDDIPHPGFDQPFWFSNDSGHDIYKRAEWPRIEEIDAILVGYTKSVILGTVLKYE